MKLRRVVGAIAGVLMATSCSLDSGTENGSINLNLSVDRSTLPAGEVMTISLTALNVGFDPLTLTGPSDCLLYIEVLDTQGDVVYHTNGACFGSTVTEELASGGTKTQEFLWNGSNLAGARLASGFYHLRGVARVTGNSYRGPLLSVALE